MWCLYYSKKDKRLDKPEIGKRHCSQHYKLMLSESIGSMEIQISVGYGSGIAVCGSIEMDLGSAEFWKYILDLLTNRRVF